MGIYYNKEYRKSFKKDNCPEDLGTTEEFVVEEGQFVSRISQADADRQAEEYAEKEGQKFANNFGGCCHVYYNRKAEGDFYSSKCTGDTRQKNPTHYTVEAGRFYSTDSPADADKMAEKALAEEGQAAADNNGQCAPIYWNNRQHGWYTKVCPDHWESKPRYMSWRMPIGWLKRNLTRNPRPGLKRMKNAIPSVRARPNGKELKINSYGLRKEYV